MLGAGQQSPGTVVSAHLSRLFVQDRDAGRLAVDRLGGFDGADRSETQDQQDHRAQDRERRMAFSSMV